MARFEINSDDDSKDLVSETTRDEFWITQQGEELLICEMTTSHLFFTVRMFWNHSAPPKLRFRPFRRYQLGMSETYIVTKMRAMLKELRKRTDLSADWIEALQFMQANAVKVKKLSSVW